MQKRADRTHILCLCQSNNSTNLPFFENFHFTFLNQTSTYISKLLATTICLTIIIYFLWSLLLGLKLLAILLFLTLSSLYLFFHHISHTPFISPYLSLRLLVPTPPPNITSKIEPMEYFSSDKWNVKTALPAPGSLHLSIWHTQLIRFSPQ